jgi:uncharacterized DUF497 family protein
MQLKTFRWSHDKNARLKLERQISFEEIALAIEGGGLLDIVANANSARYPHQRMLVVASGGHAYLVPFVEEPGHYFLKTIIPSRKATRQYLRQGEHED